MEKTAYDLMFECLKGKYFQEKDSKEIVQDINSFGTPLRDGLGETVLAYSPLLNKQVTLPFSKLEDYTLISENLAKEIIEEQKYLENAKSQSKGFTERIKSFPERNKNFHI